MKRSEFEISIDEVEMEWFIKDLLCLGNENTWTRTTPQTKFNLKFKGNIYKVQKRIYEWLNNPPRKHNFEQKEEDERKRVT